MLRSMYARISGWENRAGDSLDNRVAGWAAPGADERRCDQVLTIISPTVKERGVGEPTALAGTGGTKKWFQPDLEDSRYRGRAPTNVVITASNRSWPYVISGRDPR